MVRRWERKDNLKYATNNQALNKWVNEISSETILQAFARHTRYKKWLKKANKLKRESYYFEVDLILEKAQKPWFVNIMREMYLPDVPIELHYAREK
jgi:GTPase Era involved in 16S rRNA processing